MSTGLTAKTGVEDFGTVCVAMVTPFDRDGALDVAAGRRIAAHLVDNGVDSLVLAGTTGESPTVTVAEKIDLLKAVKEEVGDRANLIAGAGTNNTATSIDIARASADAGADALLVLPPYLVGGPQAGLVAYVEAVAAASDLPVIVYHRGNAQFTPASVRRLLENPKVVGFKDGVGDIGTAQLIVRAVAESGRDDFALFNGLLTAELTQGAYRGIGMPLYSSAAFAMIPEVANAHYRAYVEGDEARRLALVDGFYAPLVALRDETPGFGVSLIKAGLRLGGLPVGGVRPPLVDPTPEQEARLADILDAGRALL